jgi:hypothetical protein
MKFGILEKKITLKNIIEVIFLQIQNGKSIQDGGIL